MGKIGSFEEVFRFDPTASYEPSTISNALNHRKNLSGSLFLDRLFKVLNIPDGSQLYPPKTNHDLRSLHQKIQKSKSPIHHRQSLIYYLILDCNESAAEHYATDSFLPEQFRLYTRGLWCLDRLRLEEALLYLTKPGLTPTFPEEILSALVRHAPRDDMTLPLSYVQAVGPALTSPQSLKTIFEILSQVSTSDAYFFAKAQPLALHRSLFQALIKNALSQKQGEVRMGQCSSLINLPFNEEEDSVFEEYLMKGEGRALSGAKDMLAMRRLARGEFRDTLSERGLNGTHINGLGWDNIKGGLQKGIGSR